jgi:hypothetical protein
MADPPYEDSEDSELYDDRRFYGPHVPAPVINGNYTKLVVAWATVITSVLILTLGYLWSAKDSRDARQEDEIQILRETVSRQEAHIEYLQKQIDREQR